MSLRQLKFKPKFSQSKVKKNEEVPTKEVVDIIKRDETQSSDYIKSFQPDQNFPTSLETKYGKENVDHPGPEINKNVEQILDGVQAASKTNEVIGKPVLPSLRQLKCKPKIVSLPSRSSNKVVTATYHQRFPEHDVVVPKADPHADEEDLSTKSLALSSKFDVTEENNLKKLISDKKQTASLNNGDKLRQISCEQSSATKSLSPPSGSDPIKDNNLKELISDTKQTDHQNDSCLLPPTSSCEESTGDKILLLEPNQNIIEETNDDLRHSKEKIGIKDNEDAAKNTYLNEKFLKPTVLNIGIKVPSLPTIVRKDSAAKENDNDSFKLADIQSPEKTNQNQVQNEVGVVKNEVICRHLLPIRQINLPPKLRRPWAQNKTFKNISPLLNYDDNKCDNPEKKEINILSDEKKNIVEESSTEPKENKYSPINDISNSTNFNEKSPKNTTDSPKKQKIHMRKENKGVNKFSKSMKSTQVNSQKSESSLSDAEDLSPLKNTSEPIKEKKCFTEACVNNSPKKKEAKNRAVYGSKSIRSCHLGIPFKPKLTNRSKKPFASSTFGKMCFEAKAQFEKKFKDKEPDSTKLTMLDLIFYNPSSNPMPQEEKRVQTVPIKNTKNIDVPEETPKLESLDCRNKNLDSNDIPVPQLKLSSDGKVIIAQESLVVEQSLGEISEDIEVITSERFKKKKNSEEGCRAGWNHLETLKFYKALNSLGSDFETMKSIFPNRSRSNLKSKFKREERLHGKLIDKIMSQPSEFDVQKAKDELKKSLEEKETEDLYNVAINNLGRNLKNKKVSKRQTKAKHALLLKNTVGRPKRKKNCEKIDALPSDLDNDECMIPKRRKMPKRNGTSATTAHRTEETCDKNNIVISTNIEYDHLKLTQFITYNSNNLDNPIEVNTTIAHDSETPMLEGHDVTQEH